VKLVLWDIDGTLLLLRGVGRRSAVSAVAEVLEAEHVDERTQSVDFAGSTDGKIFRAMAAACGIVGDAYESKLPALRARYLERLAGEVAAFRDDPVLPAVPSVLARMAQHAEVRLGLLTGNYEPGARIKLTPFGLMEYFRVGGFGDDSEDRREVAAAAFGRSIAHHGIEFRRTDVIVVGDTEHDIDCALAHGFRAVGVCTGRRTRDRLASAGAHLVLENLTERDALERILEI